jgi:hypothetical protein
MTEPRTVFAIRIAGPAGQEGTHRLRALLKDLLRRHKFRALDVREERDAQDDHHPPRNLGE